MQDIWNEHCLMRMPGKHWVGQRAEQSWGESDKSTVMLSELPHCRPAWAASIPHQPCLLWALLEMLSVIVCLDHVASEKNRRQMKMSEWCSESGRSRLWFGVGSALAESVINSAESVTWSCMSDTGGGAVASTVGEPVPLPSRLTRLGSLLQPSTALISLMFLWCAFLCVYEF